MTVLHRGVACALLAAVLFGASTPLSKLLIGQVEPVLLAGLLYAGSGIGLSVCLLWQVGRSPAAGNARPALLPARADLGWLAAAIALGGIAGPVLLLTGLASMPGSASALLLNLEGVFTALLAWCVFHENVDRRLLLGMLAIVAAGILLSWSGDARHVLAPGALAIVGACCCWALDNNLTRKVASGNAVQIAALKGLVAGAVNLLLALALGATLPPPSVMLAAGLLGLCGYGISLVLFVVALRELGSARTGAYFSVAPFAGALLALGVLHEIPPASFWWALGLMGIGLWLHLGERHSHRHRHEPLLHAHLHSHAGDDPHHAHTHAPDTDTSRPHAHLHQHDRLVHAHPHFPDIHHQHRH